MTSTDIDSSTEPSAGPVALLRGKFALYETPGGGLHLTLHAEGEEEPRHIEVPKAIVKMLAGGKNPLAMIFGRRNKGES